jgi:hypothetical protein
MDCPITCPCRRPAAGVFALALCIYAAVFGPVFLGGNFGALIARLLTAHVVPLGLAGWAVAVGVGMFLTFTGIRPALEEGGEASTWLTSLAAIGGGSALLAFGLHLPESWGPVLSVGSVGGEVALIAGGVMNAALDLGSMAWWSGYFAAAINPRNAAPGFDDSPLQEVIERQAHTIEALRSERDQLAGEIARIGAPAHDLQEVLKFPGVRKAVLKALHRDSHPGLPFTEAKAFDARFQKASAVFARLGAKD